MAYDVPKKTTGFHQVVVPKPFENYADEYENFVETVEKNLPKLQVHSGSKPSPDADNQNRLFIGADSSDSPMGVYVSDGNTWKKQGLDADDIVTESIDVATEITDGSGTTVFDASNDKLKNISVAADDLAVGNEITNSNGDTIIDTTGGTDVIKNVSLDGTTTQVPEQAVNIKGLSEGGTVTGALTFDDGSGSVRIVDVGSDSESTFDTSGPKSVDTNALELHQPDGSKADLRVTGEIKEV